MIEPPRSVSEQIAEVLREEIADGRPAVGAALPSEQQLAARFGVSRVTVNRAVAKLRVEGVLEVRRGLDTRVISARAPVRLGVPVELWEAVAAAAATTGVPAEQWALDTLRRAVEGAE